MKRLVMAGIASLALTAGAARPPVVRPGATRPTSLVAQRRARGCHWFYLGGGPGHRKYATTAVRTGPVSLVNLDEAALIIKGPGATKTLPGGAKATLTAKAVS